MAQRAFVSRFSPNRTDPEVLEAIFVQRHRLAEDWLGYLKESLLTESRHHLLAVGPRGSGKSHLVVLLVHRLRQDPAVRERARIAWLPEDETTPSFWKFLLRILRALQAEYGDEFPPPPREKLNRANDATRAAVLTEYLLEKLDRHVLLVVVENMDDVMRGLGLEGQRRWRAFLQEHRVAATLATAQQLTKDLSSRDRPFFNFFQVELLQPLQAEEALTLLQKLAEQSGNERLAEFLRTPAGRARVRAIRHLTGGSHRVFIILSEFATRENLDNLVTAFEELLDELTPYYQERLRWLPDQQREIVELLCRKAQTVPVKEVAADLYLSEPATAAQLKVLRDKGYVTSTSWGRESRYELAEPLMRLCVEVKDPQREPIRLIVEFLRVWYDRDSVSARLECLPTHAERERHYFRTVLRSYDGDQPGPVDVVLLQDIEAATVAGNLDEVARLLLDQGLVTSSWKHCEIAASQLFEMTRYLEALWVYERLLTFTPNDATIWNNKGTTLANLGRFDEAMTAYSESLRLDTGRTITWVNLGLVLHQVRRFAEAIRTFDYCLELDPTSAAAWAGRGDVLSWLGRHDDALSSYLEAQERGCNDPDVRDGIQYSLIKQGRFQEALASCEETLQCTPGDQLSIVNRGYVNLQVGNLDDAIRDFATVIATEYDYPFAFECLSQAYLLQGNWDAAEQMLSRRFRLPSEYSRTYSWHLPVILSTVFGHSPPTQRGIRVAGITRIVQEAKEYWGQRVCSITEAPEASGNSQIGRQNPFALLGDSLLRSLLEPAYAFASGDALDGWVTAWQEAAERHPDLSLSVRLFTVGLRYVRTKDERVLLDLVQEERSILRELFRLDEGESAT